MKTTKRGHLLLLGLQTLLLAWLLIAVSAGAFTAGFAAQWLGSQRQDLGTVPQIVLHPTAQEPEEFELFWEVWDHVERDFYGDLPAEREFTYSAVRGMLRALQDPYTYFIEPSDHQIEEAQLEGRYGGIGAEYVMADGYLSVVAVLEDSPAERAGLRTGDVIISVDDTDVLGLSQSEAILLIRGQQVGTEVVLTVMRKGESGPLIIRATREEVEVPTVIWELREPDVGYVRISFFGARTSGEVSRALQELKSEGAMQLVLDLRDNPGGMVSAAVEISGQFIDGGVVFYERDKEGHDKVFNAKRGGAAVSMPLAVLVNGGTASSAEIVVGALQDHERGYLIGQRTFGKGSLQSIHELSDNSSIHVTIAHWLTPDRHEIEGAGLTPDEEIAPSEDALAQGKDPQLEAALRYLARSAVERSGPDLCKRFLLRGILCEA